MFLCVYLSLFKGNIMLFGSQSFQIIWYIFYRLLFQDTQRHSYKLTKHISFSSPALSSHWKKKSLIPFFPRVPCEYCCHTHFCVLGYDYPILPQRLETGRINGLLTPLKLSNEHIVSCLLKQKLQRHPLWFWGSCLLRMWVCLCWTKLITFKL